MLANKSGSYYEEYRRSRSRARPGLEDERLLTDRAAYQSFLEVQLERVSAACLTSQGVSDRIEEVQAAVLTFDEKINNLSRAVKLTESKGERQVEETASTVQDATRKLSDVADDVLRLDKKLDLTHRGLGRLRVETETFEQRQKDLTEVLRRRLEEKILDISSRIELEEARGKTNENRILSLGDMARAETKNTAETLQSKLELQLEALREQVDLRVSSLETRVSTGLEHFKAYEAAVGGASHLALETDDASSSDDGERRGKASARSRLQRGPLTLGMMGLGPASGPVAAVRSEVERVRQEAATHTDATAKRVLAALEALEVKVSRAADAPTASAQTVTRLTRRLDEMELRMEATEQENLHLKDEVSSLRLALRRAGVSSPPSANEEGSPDKCSEVAEAVATEEVTQLRPLTRTEMRDHVQRAVSQVSKDLRSVLEAVERKLATQSELVADSMGKVESFMDVFDEAQTTIEERVRAGRTQEKRLQAMLQATAEAMQAEDERDFRLGAEVKFEPSAYQIAMETFQQPAMTRRVRGARAAGTAARSKQSSKTRGVGAKRSSKGRSGAVAPAVTRPTSRRARSFSTGSDAADVAPSHTEPTLSSMRRRRSKTPPPFVTNNEYIERVRHASMTDDEGSGNFTDSSGPHGRDGGGKRGRAQLARVSSTEMIDSLDGAMPSESAVIFAQEPLRATDGRRDARASEIAAASRRPAWNAARPPSR